MKTKCKFSKFHLFCSFHFDALTEKARLSKIMSVIRLNVKKLNVISPINNILCVPNKIVIILQVFASDSVLTTGRLSPDYHLSQ